MATTFRDCEGILLIDLKKTNTAVNGKYYAALLHKLRDNIREKRRGKLTRGVRLLHDNAAVYAAGVIQAAILDCDFQRINHPPYSPDVAPSGYYLFGYLREIYVGDVLMMIMS
jgi:histone-lysine N-methyltransferase SETMAR